MTNGGRTRIIPMKSQPSYYYLRNREKPGDTTLPQQQLENHSEDPLVINQQQTEPSETISEESIEIHFESEQSHSSGEQPSNQQNQISDNQQTNQILEDSNPPEQQSIQQQPTEQQSIQQQPSEQQNQPNNIKMATGGKYHKVHLTPNQKYFNIEIFPIFYILYLYYCNCVSNYFLNKMLKK